MVFFAGTAQAGIESANAANRMSTRDRTRIVIDPLFHLFNLSQASFPKACERPRGYGPDHKLISNRNSCSYGMDAPGSKWALGSRKKIPPKSHYGPATP